MPRIKCHYVDCVFVDEGYCSAAAVELDPDTGCNTYLPPMVSSKKTMTGMKKKKPKNGMKRKGMKRMMTGWTTKKTSFNPFPLN